MPMFMKGILCPKQMIAYKNLSYHSSPNFLVVIRSVDWQHRQKEGYYPGRHPLSGVVIV